MNKYKKYIYIILALLVIAGVGFGVWKSRQQVNTPGVAIVNDRLVNLSAEERTLLESQIKGFQEQLKGLNEDKLKPQRAKVYLSLAGAQYKLGQYGNALNSLNTVTKDLGDNAPAWALRALIYRDMGDNPKFFDAAKQAAGVDNENPGNWQLYLDSAFASNQSNEVIRSIYDDAVRKTNDIQIIIAYAKFLEKIGDKPSAMAMWTKAGTVDSANKPQYDQELDRLKQ